MSKIITITVEKGSQKEQIVDILLEAEGDGVLAFPYSLRVDANYAEQSTKSKKHSVSECCGALIIATDICSNCKEHCDEQGA